MNFLKTLLVLSCAFLPTLSTLAATAPPKVVFFGDQFMYNWQKSPAFLANPNWIAAGVDIAPAPYVTTAPLAADFQSAVVSQHPAYVFIETGITDIQAQEIPTLGTYDQLNASWANWQYYLRRMVQMAQAANIKVIIGNVPAIGYSGELFNRWLGQFGLANNIPIVNIHDALCQCVGMGDGNAVSIFTPASVYETPTSTRTGSNIMTPNAAGYTLISTMAQIAIATYGLTIKAGYLSDVYTVNELSEVSTIPPQSNVNTIPNGDAVTFTPVAIWSDGVARPMLNQDFNGLKGTWTSSAPLIMSINQQGEGYAYGYQPLDEPPTNSGQVTIHFTAPNGVTFSSWVMYIEITGDITVPVELSF